MNYNIQLEQKEVEIVLGSLAEQSFKVVAGTISTISSQVKHQQEMAAAQPSLALVANDGKQ